MNCFVVHNFIPRLRFTENLSSYSYSRELLQVTLHEAINIWGMKEQLSKGVTNVFILI